MSMTREEAIALLNEQYEICKRIYDCSADQRKNYPNVPQFMEALGMSLSALCPITRKQVEKMRGEWVYMTDDDGCAWPECSRCEYGLDSLEEPQNFCPRCGSPMTDEAVDILWARLEAMQDAAD